MSIRGNEIKQLLMKHPELRVLKDFTKKNSQAASALKKVIDQMLMDFNHIEYLETEIKNLEDIHDEEIQAWEDEIQAWRDQVC